MITDVPKPSSNNFIKKVSAFQSTVTISMFLKNNVPRFFEVHELCWSELKDAIESIDSGHSFVCQLFETI